MAEAFFIVDLRREWNRNLYVSLWRPENAGYCYPLPWAGRYTRDQLEDGYHVLRAYSVNHKRTGPWERFPVRCEDAEAVATPPDLIGRGRIDGNAGPVLRMSAAMRAHLRSKRVEL